MALGVIIVEKGSRRRGRIAPAWAWLGLLVPIASCVPAGAAPSARLNVAAAPLANLGHRPAIMTPALPALVGIPALAANAAMPIAGGLNPAASSYVFQARTPLDQLRSLDCLAQAVYYEARSEGEDGQRAVAQVVINRVRHPAWPDSVCGVVYQGPLRAGGGCQFTFTCDGSLATRPEGMAWARARMIAADALGGYTFAAVGLSTHYHTSAVFPSWAPRLLKTAVIGAHNFYRLPGIPGLPGAFTARYAGSEPFPRPAMFMPRQASMPVDIAGLAPVTAAEIRRAVTIPSDIPQDPRWTANNLPESAIREEFRQSGQWRADAPASVSGR